MGWFFSEGEFWFSKNVVASALKLIMILKQELSPQNGRYTPLLFFHLGKNEKKRISTHSAGSFFVNLLQLLSKIFYFKIASSRGHLLDRKRTILAYCLAHILFRNKTFLFVKIDSWNFQQLIDIGLKPHKISAQSKE